MKKLITSLLLIAMLATVFASCGTSTDTASETTADQAETADSAAETTTEETSILDRLPDKKFDGKEFRIMSKGSGHASWEAVDIDFEEENGEPINDAVFTRNRSIEEEFDVLVVNKPVMNPAQTVKPLILAGEDSTELVTDGMLGLAGLITEELLVDFNDVPHIDYDAPWWDTNLIGGMSVKNKVYMMTGDISVMDNAGTWVVCFNKDLIKEYGKENPYQLVRDGAWTYDEMLEMLDGVSRDLDGDGVMGDFDQYAMVGEAYNTYVFFAGSGARIAAKDENDLPYLDLFNDRNAQALEKVFDIQNDKNRILLSDWVKGTYTNRFNECINKNFGESRALFRMGSIKAVEMLREYDVNFGIIPPPKFNEEQEQYYTSFSNGNCNAYSIPITNGDTEYTGIITEAMAALSVDTLTPAYYEITLKGKSLRDTESEDMLDLVFASRLYDLGMIYNWGGMFNIFAVMTKNDSRDFASQYAALESATQAAIDKFVASLE